MKRQLDLLRPTDLGLKPEPGRTEPRLWVKRLVLWETPGEILREIDLRPGLNIIWSPDPVDNQEAATNQSSLGHGSGKTLLCRFIRYCLGEDRFAPDDQQFHISLAFPEGAVGAEVILDGTMWAVLRPIGMSRDHFAIPGGDLDTIAAGHVEPTGIEPLVRAIESDFLSPEISALIPGDRPLRGWLSALAWLARDQECRFAHPLQWRSSASKSSSPVRTLSETKILEALRILIKAMTPEECSLNDELARLKSRQGTTTQEIGHRKWSTRSMKSELITRLGLRHEEVPEGKFAVDVLRKTAKENLARAATINPDTDISNLEALRIEFDAAEKRAKDLNSEFIRVDSEVPGSERLLSQLRGELPGLFSALDKAEHPQCPICEVPIDQALAQGCKLSHKLPKAEEIRARWDHQNEEIRQETARLQELRGRKEALAIDVASARNQADDLRRRLRAVERLRDKRAEAWYSARRMIDEIDQLNEALAELESTQADESKLSKKMDKMREQVAAYRNQQVQVFRRLTHFFNVIIREVAGSEAEGKIHLDGNGLHLSVELGGDRSTPAIDSLKVIAFDLAALCMSMEGRTHLPAFLIHDSPREADLGLSIYHRFFNLMGEFEKIGGQPQFQYIVTTTTSPPEGYSVEPWMRETLGGSPAFERLLRRDL
jgi:predicted  nucleic acid-binding Zn-ribbon protein